MRTAKARLLLVDEESPERDAVCRVLERAGYRLTCELNAADGLAHLTDGGVTDLLLLAVGETVQADELALCREARAGGVAIIALAADAQGQVPALLEGCIDDFIARPVRPAEVVYRVRRCLRRGVHPRADGQAGDGRRAVLVEGQTLYLTDREAALMCLLAHHAERVLSQEYLLQQVWTDASVSDGTLRVTIHRLRRSLAATLGTSPRILAVRGRGYVYLYSPVASEEPGDATRQHPVA